MSLVAICEVVMTIALYPGSFDPITLGHLDIVNRASRLYDELILAIAVDTNKDHHFNLEDRVQMVKASLAGLDNVHVETYQGLTVEFAKARGALSIIRGLRAVSDFEFEFSMFQMNKNLAPEIETVFMMADNDYQFLSSSMVKEVCRLGGDVQSLVTPPVYQALKGSGKNISPDPSGSTSVKRSGVS
jgi:pantetheine-phosphate adenylyltransferase